MDITVIDGKAIATSITTISSEKRLIFTVGNEHTGYKHLRERRTHFIYKNYWIPTEGGQVKLDRPSKFHPDMTPAIHIKKIVDAIFDSVNKNVRRTIVQIYLTNTPAAMDLKIIPQKYIIY